MASTKKKMQKWRQSTRPPAPRTWLDYITLLAMATWASFTEYEGDRLNVSMIRAEDNSHSIVYTDQNLLQQIQADTLYMDATFKINPSKPKSYQFFTVMAEVNNASIPIFWALMERKTGPSYTAVLSYFQDLAPHIRPAFVMSDFEDAIAVAVDIVYPTASHKQCFFHFLKALQTRARQLGLIPLIAQWPGGKSVFRKICALALLPVNVIAVTFYWLIRTRMFIHIPQWREFVRYFRKQWLRNENLENWSVLGMRKRTNNDVESYHRTLNLKFGRHPSIWDFTASLQDLVITTKREFTSMQMGYLIRENPRAASNAFQQAIHRAWGFLTIDTFNIPSFLNCAISYLRVLNNRPLTDINDVDTFVNSDLRNINDIDNYECLFCEQRVSNIIASPCNHVYSCMECAILHHNSAVANNSSVYCYCTEVIVELRQFF